MISRSDLKMLARAARNGWDTPAEKRQEAVDLAQAVIDDPTSPDTLRKGAQSALAVFEKAGWVQSAESVQ